MYCNYLELELRTFQVFNYSWTVHVPSDFINSTFIKYTQSPIFEEN